MARKKYIENLYTHLIRANLKCNNNICRYSRNCRFRHDDMVAYQTKIDVVNEIFGDTMAQLEQFSGDTVKYVGDTILRAMVDKLSFDFENMMRNVLSKLDLNSGSSNQIQKLENCEIIEAGNAHDMSMANGLEKLETLQATDLSYKKSNPQETKGEDCLMGQIGRRQGTSMGFDAGDVIGRRSGNEGPENRGHEMVIDKISEDDFGRRIENVVRPWQNDLGITIEKHMARMCDLLQRNEDGLQETKVDMAKQVELMDKRVKVIQSLVNNLLTKK